MQALCVLTPSYGPHTHAGFAGNGAQTEPHNWSQTQGKAPILLPWKPVKIFQIPTGFRGSRLECSCPYYLPWQAYLLLAPSTSFCTSHLRTHRSVRVATGTLQHHNCPSQRTFQHLGPEAFLWCITQDLIKLLAFRYLKKMFKKFVRLLASVQQHHSRTRVKATPMQETHMYYYPLLPWAYFYLHNYKSCCSLILIAFCYRVTVTYTIRSCKEDGKLPKWLGAMSLLSKHFQVINISLLYNL